MVLDLGIFDVGWIVTDVILKIKRSLNLIFTLWAS